MKTLPLTFAVIAVLVGVSCSDSETGPITTAQKNAQLDAQRLLLAPPVPDLDGNQLIYYREDLFNVNLTKLSKAAAETVINSGAPIAKIFYTVNESYKIVSTTLTDERETDYALLHGIVFLGGGNPVQFTSMTQIDDALAAGEIKLSTTSSIYSIEGL